MNTKDIGIIVEYFKKIIPIGGSWKERGYYPAPIVKELSKYGFNITHSFDGLVFYAHIQRVA